MTWRPWDPSREAVESAEAEREANRCNRHDDCLAARLKYKQRHGKDPGVNFCCHSDDCEECFGY